ncbi:MAG: hypothetical protein U0175_16770 [Caldilineaceae bacterium]
MNTLPTFKFETSLYPPSPVLSVYLSCPRRAVQTAALTALIDTGSDFSLCSEEILLEIGAPESRTAQLRGMWSNFAITTLYFVDIHLPNGILPGIEVASVLDTEGAFGNEDLILGRNVLNKLILLLEGPKQQTTILERRPLRF